MCIVCAHALIAQTIATSTNSDWPMSIAAIFDLTAEDLSEMNERNVMYS